MTSTKPQPIVTYNGNRVQFDDLEIEVERIATTNSSTVTMYDGFTLGTIAYCFTRNIWYIEGLPAAAFVGYTDLRECVETLLEQQCPLAKVN